MNYVEKVHLSTSTLLLYAVYYALTSARLTINLVTANLLNVSQAGSPEIGDDFLNFTFNADTLETGDPSYSIKYRIKDSEDWNTEYEPTAGSRWIVIDDLQPGTEYEILPVVDRDDAADDQDEIPSFFITTTGGGLAWWIIGLIIGICILVLIVILVVLIVCCIMCRRKKRKDKSKYPISDDEKEQGREPMLKNGLDDNSKGKDDEKKSLTDVSGGGPGPGDGDVDSMAEYADDVEMTFNEDGSFIGQYVAGPPPKAQMET